MIPFFMASSDVEKNSGSPPHSAWTPLLVLLLGLFTLVLLRHAWVAEDAYITFRTVANFVNGHGLVWNTGERVQTYTHPLWMALHIVPFTLTREFFFTTIALCVATSLSTVVLYAYRAADSPAMAVIGLLGLLGSKAFMDYSASGLENPLVHLTLVLFVIEYLRTNRRPNRLLWLSLLASMGLLTRLDTICFFFPALAWETWRGESKKTIGLVLLGLTPILLWELFSLLYYGFPFPNTAYAKLATGIPRGQLIQQGFSYLLQSLAYDPITLFLIGVGVFSPVVTRQWRLAPLSIGIVLNLLYVISVGGDFMSGRFLSASLFMSVVVLGRNGFPLSNHLFTPMALTVVFVGLLAPYPTVFSTEDYGRDKPFAIGHQGIADERAGYYFDSCLLRASRSVTMPAHPFVQEGIALRNSGEKFQLRQTVGYCGYFAGPKVHILDQCALTDPLLARLPQIQGDAWRIGHYLREIPEGYIESLRSGQNQIADPNLAAYYDRLCIITRGPLLSFERLAAIVKMNLGYYDDLLPK